LVPLFLPLAGEVVLSLFGVFHICGPDRRCLLWMQPPKQGRHPLFVLSFFSLFPFFFFFLRGGGLLAPHLFPLSSPKWVASTWCFFFSLLFPFMVFFKSSSSPHSSLSSLLLRSCVWTFILIFRSPRCASLSRTDCSASWRFGKFRLSQTSFFLPRSQFRPLSVSVSQTHDCFPKKLTFCSTQKGFFSSFLTCDFQTVGEPVDLFDRTVLIILLMYSQVRCPG